MLSVFFWGNFEGISVVFLEIFHDRLDWYFLDLFILLWEILVVIEIFEESFLLFFPFFFFVYELFNHRCGIEFSHAENQK